jgi:hypothetical protein
MWTPVTLNSGKTYPYGFGWDVRNEDGHRIVAHDGAWQGFTMSIARYLDTGLTVIVMTNLDENNSSPARIVNDVAKIYVK